MKKNTPRSRQKRPTATLNLKATEVNKDTPAAETKKSTSTSSAAQTTSGSSAQTTGTGTGTSSRSSTAAKSASTGSIGKAQAQKSTPSKADADKKAAADKSSKTPTPAPKAVPKAAPKAAMAKSSGGGGFMSHLLASVIGAVLGIFGLSYASNQNMLPAPLQLNGGRVLSDQVNTLTSKISMLERSTSSSEPNGIGSRLANLNTRLEKTETSLGGATPEDSTLAQKVASLQTTIDNLEKAAQTGEGGKLAGLTAVTKQLAKANKQSLALKTELVKVREEQSSFREDLTGIRSSQADFTTTTAKISDELAKLQNSTAKIVANASRPPDVSAQINPVIASLEKLTAKIGGVMNREASSKAEGRDIALALSLGELKRAVGEGIPYETELARVTPHAPKDLDLFVLTKFAQKGLVTQTRLRSSFTSYSNRALASEHTAPSGSFVDQIFANAKSMVQVRPTGLVEGNNTGAVLSRMEYKLARNDLAGSLQESEALRGPAKHVMQPWLDQANSRLGGDTVLRALEDKIRNALAGGVSQ